MPGFLEHLLPWLDEILIVDDGSTDRTGEIARAAGPKVKFIVSPRRAGEYYSHQRNKGIAAATSAWLLHMDIDERVTPELAAEILDAIQDATKDGYRFRRLNFFLHRPMRGGGWRWNSIHLACREKFHFGGKMHETTLLDAPAQRVGQLEGYMWHLNDVDYVERLRKSAVYVSVDAETLVKKRRVRWWHLLFEPPWVFLKLFAIYCGWWDGIPGLIWARHCADARFRTLALAWDRQHPRCREELEHQLRECWANRRIQEAKIET